MRSATTRRTPHGSTRSALNRPMRGAAMVSTLLWNPMNPLTEVVADRRAEFDTAREKLTTARAAVRLAQAQYNTSS